MAALAIPATIACGADPHLISLERMTSRNRGRGVGVLKPAPQAGCQAA